MSKQSYSSRQECWWNDWNPRLHIDGPLADITWAPAPARPRHIRAGSPLPEGAYCIKHSLRLRPLSQRLCCRTECRHRHLIQSDLSEVLNGSIQFPPFMANKQWRKQLWAVLIVIRFRPECAGILWRSHWASRKLSNALFVSLERKF